MPKIDLKDYLSIDSALSRRHSGMASSEKEIIFAKRFAEQSAGDKFRLISELIDIALDNGVGTGRRVSLRLLSSIAMRVGISDLKPHINRLSDVFNNERNIAAWMSANERETCSDGPGFEVEYGYALSLFTVLSLVAPELVEASADRMMVGSKSEHLRESLQRTRDMMRRWRDEL